MQKSITIWPKLAVFLAGAAVGALTMPRKERGAVGAGADVKGVKEAVEELERRLSADQAAAAERFTAIEARLDEHASRLAEVPTTAQLVGAMEQLLSKTMASLDERLTTQARSIEVLKSTVSQTDGLLERVLESLDSLQSLADPSDLAQDALLRRPAV